MVLPIAVAAQALAASLHGTTDHLHRNSSSRDVSHALSLITGVAGVGFHLYNILKRTGGFGWVNLFYAAPLGAPVALSLAGILGGLAERVRMAVRRFAVFRRGDSSQGWSPLAFSARPARPG